MFAADLSLFDVHYAIEVRIREVLASLSIVERLRRSVSEVVKEEVLNEEVEKCLNSIEFSGLEKVLSI